MSEYVKSGEEKYTNLLFVDISGAFDNLWWPSLFKAIADIGTPQYLLNVLKSYVTERSVTYRSKFAQTQKNISKGCPQGSVLGPTLWNIMMDTLVRDLRGTAGCVANADDLVVMYKRHSRRQLCDTAAAVAEVLNKWCITNRLTISPSKSAILQFGGDFNRNNPVKCKLFGRYVKTVQEWTYLGVVLDNKLLFRQHVKTTNTKASTVINTIATIAKRQYGIRPATLNVLYQGVYVSMVSYAASVWAPSVLRNKRQQYFVNAAQRRALVLLYGGYNSTSWEAMALAVGVLPMHLKLAQRAARYFLKKEDHGRISQLLDCQVEVFTRTRIEEILSQAWNEIWTTTSKGDHLRAIFPTVQDRLRCKWLQPNYWNIQFLTSHGPFASHLFKMQLRDSPECDCTNGEETPAHVLLDCPLVDRGNVYHATLKDLVGDPDHWPFAEATMRKYISTKHALPRRVRDRRPAHQEQEEILQHPQRRNPPRGQNAEEQRPRVEFDPEAPHNRRIVWVSVVRERLTAPPPT